MVNNYAAMLWESVGLLGRYGSGQFLLQSSESKNSAYDDEEATNTGSFRAG